jgi:hypothetical protein
MSGRLENDTIHASFDTCIYKFKALIRSPLANKIVTFPGDASLTHALTQVSFLKHDTNTAIPLHIKGNSGCISVLIEVTVTATQVPIVTARRS